MCTAYIGNRSAALLQITQLEVWQAFNQVEGFYTAHKLSMFMEVFTKNWKLS
jgi:hypothetical protein